MQHERSQDEKTGRSHRGGRVLGGLMLLAIGGIFLARQLFDLYFPAWLFTWPMLLIVIGFFIGALNNFRDMAWLFISGVGAVFLLNDLWPGISIWNFIWPTGIIVAGLILIFGPRYKGSLRYKVHFNRHRNKEYKYTHEYTDNSYAGKEGKETESPGTSAEILDIVSVFSSNKKTVYSKNFKGGEVVCMFGSADINLIQADLNGPVVIEIVAIFGGVKLLVPPHWQVITKSTAIFGGIEDKRPRLQSYDPDKVIILEGVAIFSGIDINSY